MFKLVLLALLTTLSLFSQPITSSPFKPRAINVQARGALGNGVTDDTTAIQAAIDYANSVNADVFFPAPSGSAYIITAQLTGYDNLTLFGEGFRSKIQQTATDANQKNVVKFTGKTNIAIRDLHFVANGAFTVSISDNDASYCGVVIRSCTNAIVKDCFFTGSAYASLFAYKSDHVTFLRNQFPAPGYVDPFVYQSQVIDILSEDTSYLCVEGNKCVSFGANPGDQGIAVFSAVASTNNVATDIIIINNEVGRKTEYGIVNYADLDGSFRRGQVNNNLIWGIDGSYHHVVAADLTNALPSIAITNVTFGTAAGDAIYMQNALESSVQNNKIYKGGLFTRANGTLVKGAIGCSGVPDIQVTGNQVVSNCYNGIHLNNSGLFGDHTNRNANVTGNMIIESTIFVNTGSITSGSTNLTLGDNTLPLSSAMTNYALGGFWRGDKILILGAGPAAANFEAEINQITNGVIQLTSTAGTTVTGAYVLLSELSGTPPSLNASVIAAITQRPLINNNTILKRSNVSDGNRAGGVRVIGNSGADLMLNPTVANNAIRGFYNGIEMAKTTGGLINGNSIDGILVNGILANDSDNRILIVDNSLRANDVGIKVNSAGGSVNNNQIVSSASSGIHSTTASMRGNTFTLVTTPYGNETPTLSVYASGTAYTVTATPALADFGTTDPSLTLPSSCDYLLTGGANFKYNGATYVANQTATVKLRKTSGTAADVTSATRTVTLRVITTITDDAGYVTIPPTKFSATAADVIQIFVSVSATPSAGSVQCDSAEIFATPL